MFDRKEPAGAAWVMQQLFSLHPYCCYRILHFAGIDYVGYALGQTDKFQGTGVFSGIKMERTPPSSTPEETPAAPEPVKEKEPPSN